MVAQNRIPARNAALLAYIGQLLLNSLPHVNRENAEWAEVSRMTFACLLRGGASLAPAEPAKNSGMKTSP